MNLQEALAEVLRGERHGRGLTLNDLAAAAGLSVAYSWRNESAARSILRSPCSNWLAGAAFSCLGSAGFAGVGSRRDAWPTAAGDHTSCGFCLEQSSDGHAPHPRATPTPAPRAGRGGYNGRVRIILPRSSQWADANDRFLRSPVHRCRMPTMFCLAWVHLCLKASRWLVLRANLVVRTPA